MSRDELLMLVLKALPYSEQIEDLDTIKEDCIRFTWRSHRFRVDQRMNVETVGDGVLIGDSLSILLETLLKRTYMTMKEKQT